MARKRKVDDQMPASPLAAKLATLVNQPAPPDEPKEPAQTKAASASETNPPKAAPPVAEKPKSTVSGKTRNRHKPSRTHKRKESRVMLDADEWATKDEVIRALRAATGEQVEFSHLMRSLLNLAAGAIPAIEANANHSSLPPRPANNDLLGLATFEDELGKFLLISFRDKKAMDAD